MGSRSIYSDAVCPYTNELSDYFWACLGKSDDTPGTRAKPYDLNLSLNVLLRALFEQEPLGAKSDITSNHTSASNNIVVCPTLHRILKIVNS